MEEAYKTPESNLSIETEQRPKSHWFWRLLFWIHIFVVPLLIVGIVFVEGLTFFDYIDLATFAPILTALYGLSFAKKVGGRRLWRAFSILYPLWAIFYNVVLAFVFKIPQYGEVAELDGWLILEVLFVLPICIALFFYASFFNRNENS